MTFKLPQSTIKHSLTLSAINVFLFIVILALFSCSGSDKQKDKSQRLQNQKGEYIYRLHNDRLIQLSALEPKEAPQYPWELGISDQYPKITKEFFRCRGSRLNPLRTIQDKKGDTFRYYDCGGTSRHSLPLRNGKEFVYPILIDMLNHLQHKTGNKIVITSGHRCPTHNTYATDNSPQYAYSKHMIGAEVAFYVQGLENDTDKVLKQIFSFYKDNPKYKDKKEYIEFQRYTKNDTNVSTQPWFNKEIFIKLYKKKEGRDFDNRHPYPYFSIQVRYDENLKEPVPYSWEKANQLHYK